MGARSEAGDAGERTPITANGTHQAAFTTHDWALLLFVGTVFGSSFFFVEVALDSFSPTIIAFSRLTLGYLTLSFFPRVRSVGLSRADARRTSFLGLIWFGVPLMIFPLAQRWIDSSVAGMLNGAMPLATVAWTFLLARILPARKQALGLSVGFLGIVAVALPEVPLGSLGTPGQLLGVTLALASASLYGLSAVLVAPLQQRYGALVVLHRAQSSAMLFVLPFAVWGLRSSTFAIPAALAMIPLGVLSTGLAFIAISVLVGRVGAARGSVAVYLVPIVSITLGVTLLGEQVHPLAFLGALLVILGAWLTSRSEVRP